MWIVKIALDRPYTFIILALLILAQPGDYPSYAGGHVSQHQYSRNRCFMDVHGFESRRV